MQITVYTDKPDDMKAFDKKEWKLYDIEHFGQNIVWDTKVYYLKAEDDNTILGTLELKVEGGIGKVNTLLVSSERLRKGVGRDFVELSKLL